jgi:hypothetical protein
MDGVSPPPSEGVEFTLAVAISPELRPKSAIKLANRRTKQADIKQPEDYDKSG